jgi:hypothetical protein
MVVGEAMRVEVEIPLSETITMVVTGLTQMVVAIPIMAATAMVDRPMTAGQHGVLILDFLLGRQLFLATTTLTRAGDQMDVMDIDLGLTTWIEVAALKETGQLRQTSTPTYQATARIVDGAREKIAHEMTGPVMTAEDGMIETETGWITMSAAGAREPVVVVEARLETVIGRGYETGSHWTGMATGTEMLTAGERRHSSSLSKDRL